MVTPNTNGAVESTNKDSVTDEKFNEQVFLMMQFKSLAQANSAINYSNFVQLNGHPSTLSNKILGTGVEGLFSITPAELALLHPKLRIFKTTLKGDKEVDVEMPFNETFDNLRLEDVVKNRSQRGAGVGIKSFDWEDMGTNPGDTGKSFKATLIITFASMADIFQSFQTDNGKVSYVDLIRYPSAVKRHIDIYNDAIFRIKVQVGWQVPELNDKISNIMRPSIHKALRNSFVTMALTLTNHGFEIDETGKVILTAQYIGALEGKMLSPDADILYVESNFESKIAEVERQLSLNKDSLDSVTKSLQSDNQNPKDKESLQEQRELFERLVDQSSRERESVVRENKLQSYSNLMRAIYGRSRIFFIDVDDGQIELVNSIRKEKFDSKLDPETLEKETHDRFYKYRRDLQKLSATALCLNPNSFNSSVGIQVQGDIANISKSKNDEERSKALGEGEKRFSSATKPKASNVHRINFVYFGDLIDAALQSLYSKLDSPSQNVDKELANFRKAGIENFRFLLGTVQIFDLTADDKDAIVTVPLGDIPISLDLFNSWFLKKVVEPSLQKYLLRDFIRDICAELIIKALSPDGLGKFSHALRERVSLSVFSLKKGNGNPLHKSDRERGNNRVNIDAIPANSTESLKIASDPADTFQYMMVYVASVPSRQLTGDFKRDTEDFGIPHFHVGSDRGILKKLYFDKVDMQYIKESRILNSSQNRNVDIFFSEPYNARMLLVGTPHFKPGMMIYLDPHSIGFPDSIPIERALPLGGYYTITKVFSKIESGKFETTINTNFETSGNLTKETSSNAVAPSKSHELSLDSPTAER